jgi:tetratricopeptide (TPR) repeat protein
VGSPARATAAARAPRAALGACAAAIAALVVLIYAPVRDHEYLDYDDMAFLVWNPDIAPASLGRAFAIAFQRPLASNWVPLTMLTHQLDRALWGRDATGALLFNAALHALGSVLLLLAFHRLTGRLAPSAFIAAVHAVHPLHVESVAWAIERKDVLSGAFFAALLWQYARYAQSPSLGRWIAACACLALGLLCKPMLVTAPCVLLLLDAWPLRRLDREAVREKAPMFALAALVSILTLNSQSQTGAFAFGLSLPLADRAANALVSTVAYLRDAFWPMHLAAYYPHPGRSLGAWPVVAAALAIAAASAGALALRRRAPWLIVGWLWYLGMLVPVLGLVQVGMQARADRYTYLPLIGITLALAFSADALARSAAQRRAAAAVGVACIAALTARAAVQVAFWHDSRSLFERVRSVNPDAAFPELRLGMVEAIDGNFDRAAPHLERAIELDPGTAPTAAHQLSLLASFQAAQGRADAALRTAQWAIGFAERTGQPEQARELRVLEQRLERAAR